jgi:glyoxylate/hydroxypyruvate reductase
MEADGMTGASPFEPELLRRVATLGEGLRRRGERLASAESCTGGLIAGACTAIAGSSDWLERGFVTYSNAAKTQMLGVPAELIAQHGAVSQQVAEAMASGALDNAPAQWSVAVTGIAGPGGAVPGKPVGTVWLAWGYAGRIWSRRLQLAGDRDAIRRQTVEAAIRCLEDAVCGSQPSPGSREEATTSEVTHAVLIGELEPDEFDEWLQALRRATPETTVWLTEAEASQQPDRVDVAVVAQPPPGSLVRFTRMRLIQSLWAGVDRLLSDPTRPAHVPLARMVDPMMTRAMVETALWAVLSLHRGFFRYAQNQTQTQWRPHAQPRASDCPVLVLGQGEMGSAVSAALRALGYPVTGWRRTHGRAALDAALGQARVLINLLPLTAETRGLLDARLFAQLPAQASVVNLARGAHLVESDLLNALNSGHIAHAVLDVFQTEPLPDAHPFWRHPRVTVVPHAAAMTDADSAARVVAENLRRLRANEPILHVVEPARGY